jgi:hypothetical protein
MLKISTPHDIQLDNDVIAGAVIGAASIYYSFMRNLKISEPEPQQPQTSQDFAIGTIFKMHDNITKIIRPF